MATDYAAAGFSFTALRIEGAAEYCRLHHIARREWRDTSTGSDGATSGLTLVCGARGATFFCRYRRDGKKATAKVGRALGRGCITVEEARRQCHRIRFGAHPQAAGGSGPNTRRRKSPDVGTTVAQAFNGYIEDAAAAKFSMRRERKALRPKTVKGYRSHYSAHLSEHGGHDLRWLAENVRQQFEDLGSKPDEDGKVHPAIANQHVAVCKAVFAWARWKGLWPDANPLDDRSVFQKFAIRQRVVNMTDAQAARLIAAMRTEPEWFDLFFTIASMGRRLDEIRTLTWDRVDLRRGTVQLLAEHTKTGQPEYLPLPEDVHTILKARHAHRDAETDGGFVFASERKPGQPVTNPHHAWRRVHTMAKLPADVCIHGLRHNAATWASESGATDAEAMRMTGHKSRQAFQRYDHARGSIASKAQAPIQARLRDATTAASKLKMTKAPRKERQPKAK